MNTAASPTLERILRDYQLAHAGAPPVDLAQQRAAEQFAQWGWPSARDEQWRYANLRAFEHLPGFVPVASRERAGAVETEALPPPLPGFERWLFIDGERASAPPAEGGTLAPAQWSAEQRFGALCDMFARDTATLRLDRDADIELVFLSSARAAGAAAYPRLQLQLQPGRRLNLVERHLGTPAAASFVCASVSIDLARDAHLTHYRLQHCGPHVAFTDTLAARLAQDAHYRVRQVTIGAGTARTSAQVQLSGRGAQLSWHAIAVGRGQQVHDTALKVEHRAPDTRTDEVFRGIADERARVAFSGHILIEPTGIAANANQSLRGLIEGAGAEIDLRPRLEIHTDEVQAKHGATTGRLDETLLFYLLARGIEPKTARALLKWAFLGDVLREIELPTLRSEAERAAAGQLRDVIELGALS